MGLLVSIEGIDKAGKSYMTERISELLREAGILLEVCSFPSRDSMSYGGQARGLLNGDPEHFDELEFMSLCALDMHKQYHEKILPTVESGGIVLCDRFVHSLLAYQGVGLLDQQVIGEKKTKPELLALDIFRLPFPHITFVLTHALNESDLSKEDCVENKGVMFLQKVQSVYDVMLSSGKYGSMIKVTRDDMQSIIDMICAQFWKTQ